ncbi:MAG: glycoside hydrolase family 3 N-terminal domain-containing protein [Bacteroidia bacterium]
MPMKLPRILLFSLCIFLLSRSQGQVYRFPQNAWVDSVYALLSPEQRIAQLIMAAAYSNPDQYNEKDLLYLIERYQIGGVIFFKGSPQRQVEMLNTLQASATIPLLVGIDAEWGLNMRLDSTLKFPRQMALAAFDDDSMIYEMGREIGRQCKRMGIHVNFAPVADINNNPNNPVINDRSFGEDRVMVSRKSLAYMRGLQDEGIIACIKHFPGHGDTETDSHYDLPMLRFPYKRLDSLELYPFRYLIDSGAMSVMTAHLYVITLDPTPKQASSLSRRIVHDKLIDSMGFEGLIFTDALNMKGVSKYFYPGDLEIRALMAGNDVLLFPEDIPAAITKIQIALDSCLIDSLEFQHSVKKVLAAKYVSGLQNYRPVAIPGLLSDLNNGHALELIDEMSSRQLTLVARKKKQIPLHGNKKTACVAIGDKEWNAFQQSMNTYGKYDFFGIQRDAKNIAFEQLRDYLKQEKYEVVVISLHNTNRLKTKQYGLSTRGIELVKEISEFSEVVLVSFGIPYNLQYFEEQENILVAYQDIEENMEKAAAALHAANPIEGKLPVTATPLFTFQTGIEVPADSGLLHYSLPERVGLRSADFLRIDSAVNYALEQKAFPGCQVLVAKSGEVVYHKSFGYFDYEKSRPVEANSIYDIASVTKVAATTLALMHLYDHGKIDLDKKASFYLKELKKTNKSNITLRQLLTHTAGLSSWIPFYKNTLDPEIYASLYSGCRDHEYTIPIGAGLFAHYSLRDSIWKWTLKSPVKDQGVYLYSDLGFFILQKIVEHVSGISLDVYVNQHVYAPLNLGNTAFNAWAHFPEDRVVPTEYDSVFRKQVIRSYVHDPAAAMLGGVGGNAGLFSNSSDLAVLMQLLLNGGTYHHQKIFKKETVLTFIAYSEFKQCRRGLGFDKPEPNPDKGTPCSRCCSANSFGHSGFTGTYVWVDPDYDLIYIFLSNRVHPDASNTKISDLNVRTQIQDLLYEFLDADCPDIR